MVEAVGGIHGAEQARGAGGGEDARHVRGRYRLDQGSALAAAEPLARRDQRQGEHSAERHAHAGPEHALLDGEAHQQHAAERQRGAADPHRPARAEPLLQRRCGSCRSRCRRSRLTLIRIAGRWGGRRRLRVCAGTGRRFRRDRGHGGGRGRRLLRLGRLRACTQAGGAERTQFLRKGRQAHLHRRQPPPGQEGYDEGNQPDDQCKPVHGRGLQPAPRARRASAASEATGPACQNVVEAE